MLVSECISLQLQQFFAPRSWPEPSYQLLSFVKEVLIVGSAATFIYVS